jgi:hypothetical protein
MQQINEKSHYSTIISSLNKEYKKTKIGKSMTPNDIYLLDVIYNLLQGCCLELSNIETKKLLKIYNTLSHTSKIICNNNYQEIYQMSKKNKFIQAEKTDCNTIPLQPTIDKIYYWQEESYITIIDDIIPLTYIENYFTDKLFDKYSNFKDIGKTINYENVGRICFYATESDDQKFIVTDILNNDVTDIFDIVYLVDSNDTIFVSKDFYTPSDIFFKFTKTNNTNDSIFDIEFNNIFQ